MSAIVHVMGRLTKDPVMQKAKNTDTEFMNLDLAVTQRSQNNENETIYYQCHFNSFQAQRLLKAKVVKGTCLWIYGDLELHPFIYKQGKSAGQAGINASINVKDWQFTISNRPEGSTSGAPGMNQNGNAQPNTGGSVAPGAGTYQNQGMSPAGNYAGNGNYAMPNGGYSAAPAAPNAPAPNMSQGAAMQAGYQSNPNYNNAPAGNGYANDGFNRVPESQMGQLPFA